VIGKCFTSTEMVLGLAAQLADGGIDAVVAMKAAIDIVAGKEVPKRWRWALGDKIADAIDTDIANPETWARPVRVDSSPLPAHQRDAEDGEPSGTPRSRRRWSPYRDRGGRG
jgi:hypothetical protein